MYCLIYVHFFNSNLIADLVSYAEGPQISIFFKKNKIVIFNLPMLKH